MKLNKIIQPAKGKLFKLVTRNISTLNILILDSKFPLHEELFLNS